MEGQPKQAEAAEVKPDFTITVPSGRGNAPKLTIGLKDIDEVTFLAAQKYIKADKELDAARLLLKNLRVSGCKAEEISDNFHALRAALGPLMEIVQPLEGQLKKN